MSPAGVPRVLAAALRRLDRWERDWDTLRRLDAEIDQHMHEQRTNDRSR